MLFFDGDWVVFFIVTLFLCEASKLFHTVVVFHCVAVGCGVLLLMLSLFNFYIASFLAVVLIFTLLSLLLVVFVIVVIVVVIVCVIVVYWWCSC